MGVSLIHRIRDAKEAFGSVGNVVGVLLASISIYNFCIEAFELQIGDFLQSLLASYRSVFHGLFDIFVTSWLEHIIPSLLIPFWVKDLTVVYLLAGNALRRSLWPAFISIQRNAIEGMPYSEGIASIRIARNVRAGKAVHFLAYLLLWPLFLGKIVFAPILYEERERDYQEGDFRRYRLSSAPFRDLPPTSALRRRYCYNIAVSLALQLIGTAAGVAVLVFMDAISK